MDIFEQTYFTLFTVASLIPTLFLWFTALFLLTIKDKSPASFHLGITFLLFGSVPACYLLTSSIYLPFLGYNRWIAAYVSLPAAIHMTAFFLSYPENEEKFAKLRKNFLTVSWIFILAGWTTFIVFTINSGVKYQFSGHNWDLDAEKAQRIVALFLLSSVFLYTFTGLWRIIKTTGKMKWVVAGILFSLLVAVLGPAIANLKSREGIISRGTFMMIYDIMVVLGVFMMIIIYINNTKDKTSFMGKIIGISLATFFLVLQFVSNIALGEKETSFDKIKHRDSIIALNNDKKVKNIKYIRSYHLEDNSISKEGINNNIQIDFSKYKNEYYNTYVLKSILNKINPANNSCLTNIKSYVKSFSENHFLGYRMSFTSFLKKKGFHCKKEELLEFNNDLQDKILPYKIKLEKFPENSYRKELKKYLSKTKDFFIPFRKAIQTEIAKANLSNKELKEKTLGIIAVMKPAGKRHYRESSNAKEHFVSYFIVDLPKNTISEVGFSYLSYRKFIHPISKTFLLMLLGVTLFIVIGFRIFFAGALLTPLNSLLAGLVRVQKGKSDTTLKVYVEDEIGFITRSFNSMVRAIRLAEIKLQRYAAGLESKVKVRTAELSKTLESVQLLKDHQDGDYFLTSLILKPLGPNNCDSPNVKTEFLVKQKKKFKFKKWSSDIGGDICISDMITLNGSRYIVFLNGDAMGKSLQGAGGALVLGAAFQSILERSKQSGEVMRQSPERWLKNSFTEMHSIFESFDGSMLMSTVFGLLEEKTGLLYFINAEHPWTVVYRDGKAKFIEKEGLFRKLGSSIIAGRISVQTFQLKHGDIVLIGSDGRDDLLLGKTEKGTRIINEDEKVFLRCVDKADANLEKIKTELEKIGSLTDDLSLLRIDYLNPDSNREIDDVVASYVKEAKLAREEKDLSKSIKTLLSAIKEKQAHPILFKELLKSFLLRKDYTEAVKWGSEYCEINPSDTHSMFALSFALKKLKKWDRAIDFGERVRLRDTKHENNLLNLADCYLQKGIDSRGKKLLQEILEMNPHNEKAMLLMKKFKIK